MNQKTVSMSLVILVVILAGTTVYFASTNNVSQPESKVIQQPTNQTVNKTDSVGQKLVQQIEKTDQTPKMNPKEIVESYVKNTLGIPANYSLVRQYLVPELQSQFDKNQGFVPQSYGIQEVPNNTIVNNASVSENKATVRVTGQYTASQIVWEFTIVIKDSEWKISNISKISK